MKSLSLIVLLFILTGFTLSSAQGSIAKAQKIYSRSKKEAKDYMKIAIYLYRDGYYFSSIPFFKEALYLKSQKRVKTFDKYLDRIIFDAGSLFFNSLPPEVLKKSQAPYAHFLIGRYYFRKGNYKQANIYFNKIPAKHPSEASRYFTQGTMALLSNKFSMAIKYFEQCSQKAGQLQSRHSKKLHLYRMYQHIMDSCQISKARTYYKMGEFTKSHEAYQKISVTSYKWPDTLLEDAWNSFQLKDYNQSIGRLLTFKAPFLKDFFYPEAEVLTALNYVKMCLYSDAAESIERFEKLYVPSGQRLVKLLRSPAAKGNFYVNLALVDNHPSLKKFEFLRNIVGNIKRGPFFFKNFHHYQLLMDELESLKKMKKQKFVKVLGLNTLDSREFILNHINQYVKQYLYNVANEINKTSSDLIAVHLEAYAKKKEKLYQSKGVIKRNRGDLKFRKRNTKQFFWTFGDEFWADELGRYVLALKSECKS